LVSLKDLAIVDVSFLSFDGDADRTVYYIPKLGEDSLTTLEGDKLGALFALWFVTIFKVIKEDQKILQQGDFVTLKEDFSTWTIGCVITAYANGSAADFYKGLGFPVVVEKTGVKYLHKAAHHFDIGIYFEANGHGNVIYKKGKFETLRESVHSLNEIKHNLPSELPEEQKKSLTSLQSNLKLLHLFLSLANQGTGDAISNFMMIECALAYLKINSGLWNEIYVDLHSVNQKIKVKNKDVIKTNYPETRLEYPKELQEQIDMVVQEYHKARAFIRPSGTEDVVRLYAEAEHLDDVKKLAEKIEKIVLLNKEIN